MPIRPTSRLDLHLVPPEQGPLAVDNVRSTWQTWREAGFLDDAGRPGPRAHALVDGGFVRVRVDDPGQAVLYANQVGGFQVWCPACGTSLARGFRPFGHTDCAACAGSFTVDALDCRPPVAVGWASLVIADAGSSVCAQVPAGWRVVLRRPA